ncbi:hypothetical protein KKF55_05090 [Patescibacteria group bacterium]|nr:hypothetical protein [Patescibacteria group bacterium]
MSELDLDQALTRAIEIAKMAAATAVEFHKEISPENAGSNLGIETKDSPRDFVTKADRAVQKKIISAIQEYYPDHRFIAEEEGATNLGDPSSPYEWIVDPIDGTMPFIHGRDNFGTILALRKNEEVVLGVMIIPLKDELYYAIKGKGAFYNGKPIVLRDTKDLNDAAICSNTRRVKIIDGIPYIATPICGNLENYGAACDEFGHMLRGHNDGCFFDGPRLWDVAAGCMMVEEAGGKSEYKLKDPKNVRGGVICVSSTAPIFDELREFVFEKMEPTPEHQ